MHFASNCIMDGKQFTWFRLTTARFGASKAARSDTGSGDAASAAAPVVVMCGSADTVTPEEGYRKIAAACPGERYLTLPGLGHAGYVEAPVLVAAEIARSLLQMSGMPGR